MKRTNDKEEKGEGYEDTKLRLLTFNELYITKIKILS
jgi:hypothetical protein